MPHKFWTFPHLCALYVICYNAVGGLCLSDSCQDTSGPKKYSLVFSQYFRNGQTFIHETLFEHKRPICTHQNVAHAWEGFVSLVTFNCAILWNSENGIPQRFHDHLHVKLRSFFHFRVAWRGVELAIKQSQVQLLVGRCQVTTLGKLLTPVCLFRE